MENQYSDSRSKMVWGLITGLFVGGVIGAGAALLFAPQSGKQTREQIRNKTLELRDQTSSAIDGAVAQTRTRVRQITGDVKSQVKQLEERGKLLFEGTRDAIDNSLNM